MQLTPNFRPDTGQYVNRNVYTNIMFIIAVIAIVAMLTGCAGSRVTELPDDFNAEFAF